jgi:hypothetical protein
MRMAAGAALFFSFLVVLKKITKDYLEKTFYMQKQLNF